LPDAISHIRDKAYEHGKARYQYGEEKYAFHLRLTTECVEALEWPHLTLVAYFSGRLDEVDESRRQLLASRTWKGMESNRFMHVLCKKKGLHF
jgi:hypothetical protein